MSRVEPIEKDEERPQNREAVDRTPSAEGEESTVDEALQRDDERSIER